MCCPQPVQVVLEHILQVVGRHMFSPCIVNALLKIYTPGGILASVFLCGFFLHLKRELGWFLYTLWGILGKCIHKQQRSKKRRGNLHVTQIIFIHKKAQAAKIDLYVGAFVPPAVAL